MNEQAGSSDIAHAEYIGYGLGHGELCLSQFAIFATGKCFRISGGTQKVFTTNKDYSGAVGASCEDLMRGGGGDGGVIWIWSSRA